MLLTTKVHIDSNNKDGIDIKVLYNLCYHSARLYNVGLYSVRQYYFNTKKYLNYNSNFKECKNNENYQILLSDSSQQILRLVDRDIQSFFRLLILKNSGKYSEKIRLPRYKDKEGIMSMPIQGRSCRIQKDGTVKIGLTKEFRELYNIDYKKLIITIPENILKAESFNEIRIIPIHNGKEFEIEFIYDSKYLNLQKVSENASGCLSIDVGVNNLMTCTLHSGSKPKSFIIDGRYVKNVNYYYNKMTSKLKSDYSKNKSIDGMNTSRFGRLSNGRNNRINDYFNKSVKLITDICLSNNIKKVVIGYNKYQKQEINNGRVNNQNNVYIPLFKLRSKLQSKCELHGIDYCPIEESYTSKASAIDLDYIPKYGDKNIPEFSGKRVKRGYYKTKENLFVNADVNGSINILRKYLKASKQNDLSSDCVRAFVNTPVRKLSVFTKSKGL